MKLTRRKFASTVAAGFYAGAANSQQLSARPVRIIVPYATGGSTDVAARLLGPRLSELLNTPVVVDNRAGGSSTIGVDAVAKSPPDGHTLGIINIAFVANPGLMKKIPYDTERDLVPLSLISKSSLVLVVHPSAKVRTLPEFVALTKNSSNYFYSSAGIGTGSHLIAERLKLATGMKMTHVPYKGGAPSVLAVLAGETQFVVASVAAVHQHIQSGRLVPLAVGGSTRHPLLPAVPTISDSVPNFEADEWVGMVVPAGTPEPVIAQLSSATVRALSTPELRAAFANAGMTTVGNTPREFSEFVKSELRAWGKVIKDVGIVPE